MSIMINFNHPILLALLLTGLNSQAQNNDGLIKSSSIYLEYLEEFKIAKEEIDENWDSIIQNSIGIYLRTSFQSIEKVKNFKRYAIDLNDAFFSNNPEKFKSLLSLKNDKLKQLWIYRNGDIDFVVRTEYRYDNKKAILHILKFNRTDTTNLTNNLITLESKLFENERGILYFEKIEHLWTHEIWAYGIY